LEVFEEKEGVREIVYSGSVRDSDCIKLLKSGCGENMSSKKIKSAVKDNVEDRS
jgi:hypothetical protein